ncbi:MAG: phospholipid carrier-dependent glycosyltransferase [Elusimicrobiota bacterium]
MKRALPGIFAGFILLLAVHLCLSYFSGAVAGGLISAAMFALVFLTAAAGGRILLRLFAVRGISESEKTLIGATLGLGLLTQAMLLIGMAGVLKPWAVSLLLGLFWIIGFTEMRDLLRSLTSNLSLLRDRPVLSGGILLLLAVLFCLTWVPPHHYDSLVYHLALPSAYIRAGRIFTVPHLLYSHFPQNGEMLYTLALLLGSDVLAQMFTWLGTFLSVWWLFEMGKHELPIVVVLGACLLTVTHTAVMLLTPTAYVECLVMLWLTASVLSFLRWRMDSDIEVSQRGWLAMAGVFAGLGVGTKYYAGICPALIALYLATQWLRMRPWSQGGTYVRGRLWDAAAFCAPALLFGAPWLVKNAVVVGNPVFPFLYDVLPPRGIAWGVTNAERYFGFLVEYGHARGAFLKDLLQFPYLAAAGSTRFGGGADVLGNLGWGLVFAALPATVWAAWGNRFLRWALFYCLAHWLIWFNTGVVMRFLTVLVPLLSLLTAHGLYKVWQRLGTAGRATLGTGVAVLVGTNLALFLYVNALFDSLPLLVGLKSRREYLAQKLDYYPCARRARGLLGENDKILVVGEQRGYYVPQPHVTTTPMAPNRFVRIANESADDGELRRTLKKEGFRYMLFVPREARRLNAGWGVFHFSERGRENWTALEKDGLETLFDVKGRCGLYRIL